MIKTLISDFEVFLGLKQAASCAMYFEVRLMMTLPGIELQSDFTRQRSFFLNGARIHITPACKSQFS